MNKKILIGIIVGAVIIAVISVISFSKSKQGTNGSNQQGNEDVTKDELDESIKASIEGLKSTCDDFLKGDLSGDPKSDCPGFDKSINQSLCLYCYAVKNQAPELCGQINNEPGLRTICQGALGIPIDNLTNQ